MKKYISVIIRDILMYFFTSLVGVAMAFILLDFWYLSIVVVLLMVVGYNLKLNKNNRITKEVVNTRFIYLMVEVVAFSILFILGKGYPNSSVLAFGLPILIFPFLPLMIMNIAYDFLVIETIVFILMLVNLILSLFITKTKIKIHKKNLIWVPLIICLMVLNVNAYYNRPQLKYKSHDFDFMNGYSSTDFSDYMVYSNPNKLARLNHEPSLIIDKVSEMPRLDGAEACYPLYSAIAKTIYKNIEHIEKQAMNDPQYNYQNGKIVTFTNTVRGYERLIYDEIDMFFGARPSKSQIQQAKEENVEFNLTEIGLEAFVFFVEKDNPIDDISNEDIKKIYSGEITNWKELGGPNQKIIAFQRPENSGSQVMMEYFMGDTKLKEPLTYEKVSPMSGIIKEVAHYNNEEGAIGYSFRYFLEGLNQEKGVKIISIDGIKPTNENILNDTYPIITSLYCVTRMDETNKRVDEVIEFLLSDDGQYLVKESGYSPIK